MVITIVIIILITMQGDVGGWDRREQTLPSPLGTHGPQSSEYSQVAEGLKPTRLGLHPGVTMDSICVSYLTSLSSIFSYKKGIMTVFAWQGYCVNHVKKARSRACTQGPRERLALMVTSSLGKLLKPECLGWGS